MGPGRESEPAVTGDEMTAAVDALASSETLAGSPRLQEFLRYIVAETLAGRAGRIRAKTIAQDVYDRNPDDTDSSDTVVRVEARRLRRLLEDYYAGEGRGDPVRLYVDSGGYVPRFERAEGADDADVPALGVRPQRRGLALSGVGAVVLSGVLLLALWQDEAEEPLASLAALDRAERRAILDRSPAALEAANMAEQARGLIYPAFDLSRQRLAAELFQAAIAMDENSAAAHAGAAQSLASVALLLLEGDRHDATLAEARVHLDRALTLDPTDAWVQSAGGWVSFVEREYGAAEAFVARALDLAPDDGNVLDTYAAVMLFSGKFEEAAEAAHPDRERGGASDRFADGNVYGGANFHLGRFEIAARSLQQNNESGGPISPPGIAFLAASYHGLGRMPEGRRLVDQLEADWPNFDVAKVFVRLHRNPDAADEVIGRLRDLGCREER